MRTAPFIQTSVQPSVGSSTAAGADKTANAGGAQSAFAGALNAADARPNRRSGASKQSDDGVSGGNLPPAGKQSPPVPAPPAAAAAAVPRHANGSSSAGRPRTERGKEKGSTPAENPLAAQAAAAASAASASGAAVSAAPVSVAAAATPKAPASPQGRIRSRCVPRRRPWGGRHPPRTPARPQPMAQKPIPPGRHRFQRATPRPRTTDPKCLCPPVAERRTPRSRPRRPPPQSRAHLNPQSLEGPRATIHMTPTRR